MKRQTKWLAGMLVVAVSLCAIAIASRGGEGDAVATPPSHSTASPFSGVQREQRSSRQGAFMDAKRVAGNGARGARLLPTPLEAEPRDKEVLVSVGVGSCGGEGPTIEKVTVVEKRKRLILTAYVLYPEREGRSCTEGERVLLERVPLKARIGKRPIYDGAWSPPTQVWPRNQ